MTGQARFFLPNPPTLKADGRADLFILCSIATLFQIVLVGRAALTQEINHQNKKDFKLC